MLIHGRILDLGLSLYPEVKNKRQKNRKAWLIGTLVAAIVIGFQLYWLYQSFQLVSDNLKLTISDALQHSIDDYLIQENGRQFALDKSSPYLSFINGASDPVSGKTLLPHSLAARKGPVNLEIKPLNIDTSNVDSVRILMARLISLTTPYKIDLSAISKSIHTRLAAKRITGDFKLYFLSAQPKPSYRIIVGTVGKGRADQKIAVEMNDFDLLMVQRMLMPSAFSFLLLLMTCGGICYLARTILEQARFSEEKNALISNIAHELRTPISILKSSTEALLQFGQSQNAEKNERYLRINADVLDKLDTNIDRLLEVTRYDTGLITPSFTFVNLSQLVKNVVDQFELNTDAAFEIMAASDLPEIKTDPQMIETILSNLIDNAVKYAKGRPFVRVSISTEQDFWVLSVEDHGKGIDSRLTEKIFEPFYRIVDGNTHDVKGYGVGLSHVRELLRILEGRISVVSKLGQGSLFSLKFKYHGNN